MDSELSWRKASRSGGSGGNCVEAAFDSDGHAAGMIRDSKSPEQGQLTVTTRTFALFLATVKSGEYDTSPASHPVSGALGHKRTE